MKKTILIVDDFENTLFVTALTLQTAGYNVLKAKSGTEALRQFAGQKIDLMITDYNMPGMNGIELVQKVKQNPLYKQMPVFILSTEINPDVKRNAFLQGVTTWIAKPFKIDDLKQKIQRVI